MLFERASGVNKALQDNMGLQEEMEKMEKTVSPVHLVFQDHRLAHFLTLMVKCRGNLFTQF